MSRVDILRGYREEKIVCYDKFIRIYPKHEHYIFCFYEGKMDHTYYENVIRIKIRERMPNVEPYPIDCGGKSKVIYMRNKMKKNVKYQKCRAMFFVDRDFDEAINLDDVFETPCYSLENLYVTENALIKILRGQFELDEDNYNYKKILELHNQLSQQFHEKIYNFNAWVFFQRMQGRKNKNRENKISLDQFDKRMNQNEIIKVFLDKIEVLGTSLRELKDLFPKQYETKEEDLELLKGDFRNQNPSKWYRGKQEFYFFCTFLGKVIEQLGKARKGKSDIFEKDTVMKVIELNPESQGRIEQNIQLLSSYADVPKELYNYIDKMCNRFQEVV